jgi:hypothetical protein
MCRQRHTTSRGSQVPDFWKNVGTKLVNGVEPGQVSLHPGFEWYGSPFDDASLIRFTAPADGTFHVRLALFAGNGGETEAWLIKNSDLDDPVAHFPMTSLNPTWNGKWHCPRAKRWTSSSSRPRQLRRR